MTSRAVCTVAVAGLGLGGLLGAPAHSGGDPGPVSQLNWIFDGAVQGAARLVDTLYVGGTFQAVAPSANALPSVFALSETSGGVAGSTFPQTDGDVRVIEPDGAGGYFVAGTFSTIGGIAQAFLAHVTGSGSVDTAFRPVVNGEVFSLARIGTSVYLSGSFSLVGSVPVPGLAAVSTADGARLTWSPVGSSMGFIGFGALAAGDDRVAVVEIRGTTGNSRTPYLVALDAVTGASLWSTLLTSGQVGTTAGPVLRVGSQFIVAHSPSVTNGGLSRVSLATGVIDPAWNPGVSPAVLALSGSTLYLGGFFTSAGGQPRQSLAAIDVETAALLPWNPGSLTPIIRMAATSTGNVYVSGLFSTIAGQPRHRLAQIDVAGNVTPWIPDARPDQYYTLREGAPGQLLVASSLTATGSVARPHAAAFDLTTGALLPWTPTPAPTGTVTTVAAGGGQVFLTVGSFTFTFDAASGASVGSVAGEVFFAEDPWVYFLLPGVRAAPRAALRMRIDSGVVDESWLWSAFAAPRVAADATTLYFAGGGLTAVDKVTGRVRWQRPTANVRHVAIGGDTVYTDSGLFGFGTFDARTGATIATRSGSGVAAMAVADGRLIVAGSDPIAPPRAGFTGLTLDLARRVWTPSPGPTLVGGPSTFLGRLDAPGNLVGPLLVTGGIYGSRTAPASQGLAAFPLDGPRAPSGLRARPRGPATEFTWDTPTSAPSGGYVLEAGSTPGTPAVAIPVGATPTFSAIVPPGTFFVRVRTVGAVGGVEEVSNEVAVVGGCTVAPPPPTGLQAAVTGDLVNLAWTAPDANVSSYVVMAGAASGASDVATVVVTGDRTTFTAQAPLGTYYVRVRAANACGTSPSAGEVFFTVGASAALPAAPTGATASVATNTVSLQWSAPGGSVTGYILEAGSDIGLSNITTATLGPATSVTVPGVPPGLYLVRVRAVNAAGSGPPSADVVVRVP